jgi:hypothetical protein
MFVLIKKGVKVPLFLDIHQDVAGLTTEAVAEAHGLVADEIFEVQEGIVESTV